MGRSFLEIRTKFCGLTQGLSLGKIFIFKSLYYLICKVAKHIGASAAVALHFSGFFS